MNGFNDWNANNSVSSHAHNKPICSILSLESNRCMDWCNTMLGLNFAEYNCRQLVCGMLPIKHDLHISDVKFGKKLSPLVLLKMFDKTIIFYYRNSLILGYFPNGTGTNVINSYYFQTIFNVQAIKFYEKHPSNMLCLAG